MTTPTFDTIEAQASYGIGLQVGQQLSESGLQGLLPEALVAGIADALEGKHPAVPVDVVHRALREIHERADRPPVPRDYPGRRRDPGAYRPCARALHR